MSTPIFGLCPVGRDWLKESSNDSGKDWMKAPPQAPQGRDATDEVMTNLARKKINAFSGIRLPCFLILIVLLAIKVKQDHGILAAE